MRQAVVLLVLVLVQVYCAYAASGNPFDSVNLYVDARFIEEVDDTIQQYPTDEQLLNKTKSIPVAYWLDSIAKISNLTAVLQGAKDQQASSGVPTLTTIVVYDLPDRDCAAAASNGEITCADATCAAGLAQYQSQYIDALVSVLQQFAGQPVVAIIEPDSLPNLATNLNVPKCQQAELAYITGVSYAIQQLSALSDVTMYVDAGHGGWLGWDNNRLAAVQVFSKVLTLAGGFSKVRGFATNTANYQPLGSVTSTADPCNLMSQSNKAINEAIYIQLLSATLQQEGITGMYFITDTSRNGVINERSSCSNWCNINGAGFGIRPTANTSTETGVDNIDAFVWVKIPGESDGSSDSSAPRYDFHCGSADSVTPAPQAGDWFPSYFLMLANNAVPAL